MVNFPKGLQKRAENAFLEQHNDCEEGCGDESGTAYRTLNDYLENHLPQCFDVVFEDGTYAEIKNKNTRIMFLVQIYIINSFL